MELLESDSLVFKAPLRCVLTCDFLGSNLFKSRLLSARLKEMGYIFPSLIPISWIPLSIWNFVEEVVESVPVRTRIEIVEGCLLDVKIKGFITVLLTYRLEEGLGEGLGENDGGDLGFRSRIEDGIREMGYRVRWWDGTS